MICTTLTISAAEPIPAGFALTVDGKVGTVSVPINTPVKLRTQGGDAIDDVMIGVAGLSAPLCKGDSDSQGVFECMHTFSQTGTYNLKGYEDCIDLLNTCIKQTVNTVQVTVVDAAGGFKLTVNGQSGNVQVANNSSLALKVTGSKANNTIEIYVNNIFPIPDTLIASGTANAQGEFTATVAIDSDVIWDIYAVDTTPLPDVVSNTVRVTAGTGIVPGYDWKTIALYGAGALVGIYILSNIFRRN